MKVICMIPARIGSKRIKKKNLRLINNKPLVSYVIEKAKKCKLFSAIYLNSDSIIFEKIAKKYGVNFYHRNKKILFNYSFSIKYIKWYMNRLNNFCIRFIDEVRLIRVTIISLVI